MAANTRHARRNYTIRDHGVRSQAVPASLWRSPSGFPSSDRPPHGRPSDAQRWRDRLAECPEIDCIRHRLSPGLLAAAELRAAEIGTGADQVLIAQRLISEEGYVVALSHWLHIRFETFETITRATCPLDDALLVEAPRSGLLPLHLDDELLFVIAPGGLSIRRLVAFLKRYPEQRHRIRLTTRERLTNWVRRAAPTEIEHRATSALKSRFPQFSAGIRWRHWFSLAVAAASLGLFGFFAGAGVMLMVLNVALAAIFLAWAGLRFIGALTTALLWRRRGQLSDDQLPVYSILVALYREEKSVSDLVRALQALDYPPEKLDIKLVIEPDDIETQLALDEIDLPASFEICVAPAGGPRTKPKALNSVLPFVRGEFLAIYDAEDRPEPDQLRAALQAFSRSRANLACVQARLTIDNSRDSWLTRMFTAEYAGLFDVLLPGIAAWGLPLPLGGTSNHFRTDVLLHVGAWDAYNVTEDADLGMRLARFGYRTGVIPSSTYEEAPARLYPWLRQRTRWFKGWMQTWLVHMRQPLQLLDDLGPAGFAVFHLALGGSVLTALAHLPFVFVLGFELVAGFDANDGYEKNIGDLAIMGLHSTALLTGYAISATMGLIGLSRRGLLSCAWVLLLMPLYWLLLSVAAWRALVQLIIAPYHWEKTEHGLARTSRMRQNRPGSSGAATDSGADRRRPRRAYA